MKKGDLVIARGLITNRYRPWNGELCLVVEALEGRLPVIKRLSTGETGRLHPSKFEEYNHD